MINYDHSNRLIDRLSEDYTKMEETRIKSPGDAASAAVGKLKIYLTSVTVLSGVAALLRTLAVLFCFDADPGYFRKGLFPSIANALVIVSFIIIMSAFFLIPKELPGRRPAGNGAGYFASTFAAFVCLFEAGYRLYTALQPEMREKIENAFEKDLNYSSRRLYRIAIIVGMLLIVASAGSAVSFFLRSASSDKELSERTVALRVVFGSFPVVRVILGFASIYFDQETVMNGSAKLICESAQILLILFFLQETRMDIGKSRENPRAYAVFGLAALLLSSVAGISTGIGWIAGKVAESELMIESMFLTVVAVYVWFKVKDYVVFLSGYGAEKETEALPAESGDVPEDETEARADKEAAEEAEADSTEETEADSTEETIE